MMKTNQKTPTMYELFDGDEHRAWKRDRALRRRVPLGEAWRGCVGLAAMLDNPEFYVDVGAARVVPDFNVAWVALRDVPVGHCPGSPVMHRRDVNLATMARGAIRHGMPSLDFARSGPRDSWDLKFMPFDRFRRQVGPGDWDHYDVEAAGDTLHSGRCPRTFAVLNRLSAAMTRHAFCAVDRHGRPARPAWATLRPDELPGPEPVVPPRLWFPTAYLGFPVRRMAELLSAAAAERMEGKSLRCDRCGEHVGLDAFRLRRRGLRVCPAGVGDDFVANCPACGARHKWRPAQAVAARTDRHFPIAFRDRFCRAVAEGLPLHSVGPSVYCGATRLVPARDFPHLPDAESRRLALVPYRFLNELTGERYAVYLPPGARVEARQGAMLAPGQRWCHALAAPPDAAWAAKDRIGRWNGLDGVLSGSGYVGLLQSVWLRHQGVMHEELGSHQFLLPADLVSLAGNRVRPIGLFWDFRPAQTFFDEALQAAIFPPLRLHRWDQLRFNLPGDVAMDATIVDPRFATAKLPAKRDVQAEAGDMADHAIVAGQLKIPTTANAPKSAAGVLLAG